MGRDELALILLFCLSLSSRCNGDDASVMLDLKKSLTKRSLLDWSATNPCNWNHIGCSSDGRITRIQIGRQALEGTLPETLRDLTELQHLEVQYNHLSGPLPTMAGLSQLQVLLLNNNNFTSIPSDFFLGMSSLQSVTLDSNPLSSWELPESLKNATSLQNFSANSANLSGYLPDFMGNQAFVGLTNLHLSFNNLQGGLPSSFSGSSIQSLWLNGQMGSAKLSGSVEVLKKMTMLREAWLHSNDFSGSLPDFTGLDELQSLSLRDNQFTGIVPLSLTSLPSLKIVNLTNNLLQGPMPMFGKGVAVDMAGTNRFCLPNIGTQCDQRVNVLLDIAESMDYPRVLADNWAGNNPCAQWLGLTCDANGNVSIVNFQKLGLSGMISANFSTLTSLQRLILANNNLSGVIPAELTKLPNLREIDVSNNEISGKIPVFRSNVVVKTDGNPNIGKDVPSPPNLPSTPPNSTNSPSSPSGTKDHISKNGSRKWVGVTIGSLIGCTIAGVALVGICLYCRKQKRFGRVQSPNTTATREDQHELDLEGLKFSTGESYSLPSSGPRENYSVEMGSMSIPIHVLRSVTNSFSGENILGRGGFGTVYRGELHDGTMIAVKRMESGVLTEKGLAEFKSEIAVLTKVRHRHLVALLGYCLDGNERLLVYEYMPQGTLSRHLFEWGEEGLKPLGWNKRLTIALDVARGVEYLHGLAHQSFIHRDLKPSNILLGDDMRAKVADFGLVRLAPEGKGSIETRLAGTFGYLAPEYAVTGRVTTKVDVFSFGVILMELVTGRKALDDTQPEDSMHLVTWFRRMHIKKDTFRGAIDPTLDIDDETLSSIGTVAELAGHCCTREPHQRPDMGHAVNVLSSLVELWKPVDPDSDDMFGIDLEMPLPQAVKKWQASEGSSNVDDSWSSYNASTDNTQTSIPVRPAGFAESFTSADGR